MLDLRPYPTEDNPIGFVEDRPRGKRVIIVIDDLFDLPNCYSDNYKHPATSGLWKLYDTVQTWDLRRGIGFFDLPDPTQIEERSNAIIDAIDDWVKLICCDEDCEEGSHSSVHEEYSYYVLVDFFFGNEAHLVGHKFIDYWKKRQIVPKEHEKLAYFSTAGAYPGFVDPHHLPVFQKGRGINQQEQLSHDLKEWLDFESVPLERVWEKSVGWFDDAKSNVVRHDFSSIEQYFIDKSPKATKYKQVIEDALGVKFPDAWWQDLESVKNIHESLKHLCGEVFCGNTHLGGCRNVSVGAAYLIALKVHQELYGNIDALASSPSFWKGSPRITSAVFSIQGKAEAKSSAIALYDFFYHTFKYRGSLKTSQVKTAFFEQGGVVLKIQLKWKATEKASDRSKSLVQMLMERFDSEEIDAPDPEDFRKFSGDTRPVVANNTRDAISRLWRNMMFNSNGFMSPGVVYMEKDEIIIASTEYLVWGDKEG